MDGTNWIDLHTTSWQEISLTPSVFSNYLTVLLQIYRGNPSSVTLLLRFILLPVHVERLNIILPIGYWLSWWYGCSWNIKHSIQWWRLRLMFTSSPGGFETEGFLALLSFCDIRTQCGALPSYWERSLVEAVHSVVVFAPPPLTLWWWLTGEENIWPTRAEHPLGKRSLRGTMSAGTVIGQRENV